ncbi:MAG: GNAT family N-acetyltransferase [Terriglobales bacterium]
MRETEAESLNALFTQVVTALPYYNELAKTTELAKYSPQALRDATSMDPDSVLVARIESDLVGFCLSRNDDGLIWLSWFGVHADHRRKGIGAALVEKLEATVRKGRSHKIWCDCRTENEASKILLSKHGYQQLCVARNHWYGQDFILWEKLIS